MGRTAPPTSPTPSHLLQNQKVHHRAHNSTPQAPILSHTATVHNVANPPVTIYYKRYPTAYNSIALFFHKPYTLRSSNFSTKLV